jgi:acetyl esterase
MSLDQRVKAMLDQMSQMAMPKLWELGPQAARAAMRSNIFRGGDEPIGKSEDRTLKTSTGDVPVRIYTPVGASGDALPALVFYHGGGFVLGDLESHDDICRCLANGSGCRVIAVDYRLAPEHPFPAAVDDCWAATQYIAANPKEFGIDASRLAVGGDSAGGNLAAVVSQLAKQNGGTPSIKFQLLIYPVTQLGSTQETVSMRENAKGYFLEKDGMDWFTRCYVTDPTHRTDPRVSPLLCKDLTGLPPAYVITAGFDPLRDEGKDYAEALDKAGVSVTHVHYPSMVHGFFSFRSLIPKAREALSAASAAVRADLTPE